MTRLGNCCTDGVAVPRSQHDHAHGPPAHGHGHGHARQHAPRAPAPPQARSVLTDNVQLAPGTYTTFEWVEDDPGSWLVHCHVPKHMEGGMMARYVVSPQDVRDRPTKKAPG